MSLSPQFLDELRARTHLSALIGKSIKVTRAGREWKACCPFHNESTPSFTINDEKAFWHCFGCGAHGDAIRWMTDHRGLTFIDAVKELAGAAGMDVPQQSPQQREQQERQRGLIDVTETAAMFFQHQLQGPEGRHAQAYIAKRGLTADIVKRFGIGYAPDSKTACRGALAAFPDPLVIQSGMLIQVDDKEPYDRFRARLMIPIKDPRGRVIAFGGRILGDGQPKYLNSPDTPLFDKGRALFNYDLASAAARKSGRLVAVEGYMDAIACVQAGIEEVVAPLGTAMTEQQMELMWRLVSTPVVCFDGDAAGQKAAMRAAERALPHLKAGRSLSFALLPSGEDPDDFLRRQGKGKFVELLAAAEPLVLLLWRNTIATMPAATPEDRAAIKARLGEYAGEIRDRDVRDGYFAEFRRLLDEHFAPPPRSTFTRGAKPEEKRYLGGVQHSMDDVLPLTIVNLCVRHPAVALEAIEQVAGLSLDPATKDLLWHVLNAAEAGDIEGARTPPNGDLALVLGDLQRDTRLLFRTADEATARQVLRHLITLEELEAEERQVRGEMVGDHWAVAASRHQVITAEISKVRAMLAAI